MIEPCIGLSIKLWLLPNSGKFEAKPFVGLKQNLNNKRRKRQAKAFQNKLEHQASHHFISVTFAWLWLEITLYTPFLVDRDSRTDFHIQRLDRAVRSYDQSITKLKSKLKSALHHKQQLENRRGSKK